MVAAVVGTGIAVAVDKMNAAAADTQPVAWHRMTLAAAAADCPCRAAAAASGRTASS